MKKLLCTLLVSVLLLAPSAAAETNQPIFNQYDKGNQLYSISGAPMFNLFLWIPSEDPAVITDQMKLGGYLSIGWEAFTDHRTSIGAELGFGFAKALDTNLYTTIPFLGKATCYLLEGNVDLPISLGVGLAYNSFGDQHYLGFAVKPEIGGFVNISENWSLGLKASYLFIPELYADSSSKTAFGNFLNIQAVISYAQ